MILFVHLKLFIHITLQVNGNVGDAEDWTVYVNQSMIHLITRLQRQQHQPRDELGG